MTQWHEDMSGRLRIAAEAVNERRASNNQDDEESIAGSSVGSQSIVGSADYFHSRSTARPYHASANVSPVSPKARRPEMWHDEKSSSVREQRRRSLQDQDGLWPRDGTTPTEQSYRRSQRSPRSRPSSVLSVTTASESADDSSTSASEATPSPEPAPRRRRHHESLYYNREHHGRRHSAHEPFTARDYVPSRPRSKHGQNLSPQFYTGHMASSGHQNQRPSTSSQVSSSQENNSMSHPTGRSPLWRGGDGLFDPPDGSEPLRARNGFRSVDDERGYFEVSRRR